jgi:hypothetical protein
MPTMSQVIYSARALQRLLKGTGNYMEPTSPIFLLSKPYKGLDSSLSCLMSTHLLESGKEYNFCLTTIIDQYSCHIPFVDVRCDHHYICVREGYKLDVGFGECYLHVRPLGPHDWTFDYYMIDLTVVLSLLPLVFKI